MMQQLNTVSGHASGLPMVGEANVVGADLGSLLSRYSELSQDIARLQHLLEDLAQHVISHRTERRPRSRRMSRKSSGRLDSRRQASPQNAVRRKLKDPALQAHSKLERACLIALMEANQPAAVETIYDRIERRGSFTFAGYKHPFRAIILSMGAMVRRGEALLCNEGGRRRWRREPQGTPVEELTPLTLA